MAYGTCFPLFKCDRDICDDIYILLFIYILYVYIHICVYIYSIYNKHRVYLKFLQGSLSSSLELVGCLGDACRNFPCHHEGGCSTLDPFWARKSCQAKLRQAWSSSVASKHSTAQSCLGCRCILGTCGAEVQDVGVAGRF